MSVLSLQEPKHYRSSRHIDSISRPCSTSRLRFASSHSIPLTLIISLHSPQASSRMSSRRSSRHPWQQAVDSTLIKSGCGHESATLGPLPSWPLLATSQTNTVSYSVWLQNKWVSTVRHIFGGDVRYTGVKAQMLQNEEQQVAFYLTGMFATADH